MEELLNKRVPLANLPTPVQHMSKLSKQFNIELYVKRDDLTESVASGNKLRKMEYVLYNALAQGADTLATCGGLQSNHCRTVAWVAAKAGIDCQLLLRGENPPSPQGNYLIDSLLGAETRFFSPDEFMHINEIGKRICTELSEKGKKPYYIPMGASVATGSIGYIRMVKELVDTGEDYDKIYCALGSGGTFAGILMGHQYYSCSGEVRGIAVCDDTTYFINELKRIQQEFIEQYDLPLNLAGVENTIDDNYVGIGYSLNTEEELRTLIQTARTEGLILDPVYTLKAFIGMTDHIRKGTINPGERVLFIHTGGHYGIFPKNAELEGVLDL